MELQVQGLSPQPSISSLATKGSQVTWVPKLGTKQPTSYFDHVHCSIIHFGCLILVTHAHIEHPQPRHTEHGLIITWARPGLQGLGTANPCLGHLGVRSGGSKWGMVGFTICELSKSHLLTHAIPCPTMFGWMNINNCNSST